MKIRTVHLKVDGPIEFGFGVDLALVKSGVAALSGRDAQLPVVGSGVVNDAEACVRRVADAG